MTGVTGNEGFKIISKVDRKNLLYSRQPEAIPRHLGRSLFLMACLFLLPHSLTTMWHHIVRYTGNNTG